MVPRRDNVLELGFMAAVRLSLLKIALSFCQCSKKHGNSQNNDLALEIENGVAYHQLVHVVHVRADVMRN